MEIIALDDIHYTVGIEKKVILKSISWHINAGERWILLGRNGSGKSKLLEIITGFSREITGTVVRFGEPSLGADIRAIRQRIGYVSSSLRSRIYPNESILDLIISGYYSTIGLYTSATPEIKKKAMQLLTAISLGNRANDLFLHLSDGEKQKILIARALISKPELLILDEPSSALDIAAREDLLHTLETLLKRQSKGDGPLVTVLYVTHHVEEITPLFTHAFILKNGICHTQGKITETITNETLTSLFEMPISVKRYNGRYTVRF